MQHTVANAFSLVQWITIANELQAVCTVLSFWTDAVPVAAWISIFWLVIVLVNVGAVNIFGEIEVVCSMIKFGWIFVVIFAGIVISAGGAPNNEAVGFRYVRIVKRAIGSLEISTLPQALCCNVLTILV